MNEDFNKPTSENPHNTSAENSIESQERLTLAGCIIKDDMGRILLLHRNSPNRTQWEIPGGKIDEGESPERTAEREIEEELGVDIELGDRIGMKEFEEDGYVNDYIWYSAVIVSGTPKAMEDKFDELRYFSIEELMEIQQELSPNTMNFLEALQRREIQI